MSNERRCAWMSGPKGASVQVSPAKWWLVISRDLLANDFRRSSRARRPPVACRRTPKFVSPLNPPRL